MKKLVALMAATAFLLSVGANYCVAEDKPVEKPKTECSKCAKECKGADCKCSCHAKKEAPKQ